MTIPASKPKGRPRHEPTAETRQIVQLHATVGTEQDVLAQMLGISSRTLRKHYRRELDFSLALANATVGGALFKAAKAGNVDAQKFWLTMRGGWRRAEPLDPRVIEHEPEGEISDARSVIRERIARIAAARAAGDNPPDAD